MKKPIAIAIHHTAYPGQRPMTIDGVLKQPNPNQWQATDNYHKSKGWGGGGYNAELSIIGGLHVFRVDGAPTAAQYQPWKGIKDTNDGQVLSICLDGYFDVEDPTPAQKIALAKWVTEKMTLWNIPKENVVMHRTIAVNAQGKPLKSCPGSRIPDSVYAWLFPTTKPAPAANAVTLYLYQHKPTGRIYLVKGMVYYPIADEATYNLLFNSFGQAHWSEGDIAPSAAETGKVISLT